MNFQLSIIYFLLFIKTFKNIFKNHRTFDFFLIIVSKPVYIFKFVTIYLNIKFEECLSRNFE